MYMSGCVDLCMDKCKWGGWTDVWINIVDEVDTRVDVYMTYNYTNSRFFCHIWITISDFCMATSFQ